MLNNNIFNSSMYKVSGSNLHGQWFSKQTLLLEFKDNIANLECDAAFDITKVELIAVTWSYNIFLLDDTVYLSGAWCGKENSLVKIKLPFKHGKLISKNIIIVGNDYKLFLVDVTTSDLWILKLEDAHNWNWIHKKIYFDIESHLEKSETGSKKPKIDINVQKAVPTQSTLFVLASDGAMFELPNRVKSNHITGRIQDLDYGYEHGILLTDAGIVYTWGNGKRCQLGHGDLNSLEEPSIVEALAGIKILKVKAGGWHSLALSESGDLYAWGWNDTGQLGIRENSNKECLNSYPIPTLVDLYDENNAILEVNIRDIGCGSKHSAIILEDNTVWTTGLNKYGQLGFCKKEIDSLNYFKKSFHCFCDCKLLCGPWCTVLCSNLLRPK